MPRNLKHSPTFLSVCADMAMGPEGQTFSCCCCCCFLLLLWWWWWLWLFSFVAVVVFLVLCSLLLNQLCLLLLHIVFLHHVYTSLPWYYLVQKRNYHQSESCNIEESSCLIQLRNRKRTRDIERRFDIDAARGICELRGPRCRSKLISHGIT